MLAYFFFSSLLDKDWKEKTKFGIYKEFKLIFCDIGRGKGLIISRGKNMFIINLNIVKHE